MVAIAHTLIQKSPTQRLTEVEDFTEFLAVRETRTTAGMQLGEALKKLDALNLPQMSDDEIEAEIRATRQEHAVTHD